MKTLHRRLAREDWCWIGGVTVNVRRMKRTQRAAALSSRSGFENARGLAGSSAGARISHPGPSVSPSIFDGGSDARIALDDAVKRGNNPYRCTCRGSDVRSTLPGLHAGLQQRGQLYRVWLYVNGSMCGVGVRPRSSVLRQPILCAYRQESLSQGLSAAAGPEPVRRTVRTPTRRPLGLRG